MTTTYETYKLELNGSSYRVEYHYDESMREPWKEHDGHGIVSDWTSRDKRPGERVLVSDRSSKRYYDIGASVALAKRDGWGDGSDDAGRTKGQIAASAVERDFDYCKGWCEDRWHWIGVVVTLLDVNGEPTNERESLWGIDGDHDAGKYLREVALELAGDITARIPADGRLSVQVKA